PRLFGSHSWCRRGASFSGQRRRSRAHRASVRSLFGTIARRLGRFRPGPSLFSALRSYASRMSAGNFSAAQPVKESGHEARSSPEPRAFRRPSTDEELVASPDSDSAEKAALEAELEQTEAEIAATE